MEGKELQTRDRRADTSAGELELQVGEEKSQSADRHLPHLVAQNYQKSLGSLSTQSAHMCTLYQKVKSKKGNRIKPMSQSTCAHILVFVRQEIAHKLK